MRGFPRSSLAVALTCALGAAQEPAPFVATGLAVHPDRLAVKLAEGCGAVLKNGALVSRTGVDLSPAASLFARARAEHLIHAPLQVLDRWHRHAHAVLPDDKSKPGHLALWFRLSTTTAEEAEELLVELRSCPLVESCELEPVSHPCGGSCGTDPPPPTPLFTSMQNYADPAPLGIHSRFAQGIVGGRGRDLTVTVVELDWLMGHEDLSKVNPTAYVGVPSSGLTPQRNHGSAGSGLLVGDRNCFGITGMADEADIQLVSHQFNGGVPNSIIMAALGSLPGDVIMSIDSIGLFQLGPNDYVPGEYYQATFDAIQTVTANGWIVVNAAANGYRSLDDPRLLLRFDLGYRDSGAIMASATDGSNLWRAGYTNYGSRIDANGWGQNVVTTGYGGLFRPSPGDPLQEYTARYSGNSAATPIVTATVLSLLGAAKKQLGRQLTWQELRQLLRTHGSATAGNIGTRPDLREMFITLGILDGLEMSSPDVPIGGSADVILSRQGAGSAFLFVGFDLVDTNVGLNRPAHLAPLGLVTVGFLPMPAGTASYRLQVPNISLLRDSDVFFQAVTLDNNGGSLHVTNSGVTTVY